MHVMRDIRERVCGPYSVHAGGYTRVEAVLLPCRLGPKGFVVYLLIRTLSLSHGCPGKSVRSVSSPDLARHPLTFHQSRSQPTFLLFKMPFCSYHVLILLCSSPGNGAI